MGGSKFLTGLLASIEPLFPKTLFKKFYFQRNFFDTVASPSIVSMV
jgi:hypothetical protein